MHATSCPAVARPKSAMASGGVAESNDEYATTQPVSPGVLHVGTFWNEPPTFLPAATVAPPPMRSADSIFARTSGTGSTSFCIMPMSMPDPCECPIRTNFRPLFMCAR